MDIYAEAHHTTAIFYQVIIDLHQTLCTVAPKIPSFLSSPNFLWKAKKSWGWFGCSGAEVFWCCYTPYLRCLLKTQLITPPIHFPKYSPAPEKRRLSENESQAVFCVEDPKNCDAPRQAGTLGGSEGAAVTGVGKKTLSILCSTPNAPAAHLGLFLGLPGPGRLRCLCLSALWALQECDFHQVITSGSGWSGKKE